jgi:hypothetical protein
MCGASCILFAVQASAQSPDGLPLPAPRPESALVTAGPPVPPPVVVPERPPAYVLPPVDGWTTAGTPSPDPLLDRPGSPLPGPFVNVETNVLAVAFRNQLNLAVPVSATRTDTVSFFGPGLDATVSPRFEFGCRLDDGWGELLLGYRFLCTEGSNAVASEGGPAHEHGRVALNSIDFGYASREFALGPCWDMRWRTGVRTTFFYYDARQTFDEPGTATGTVLDQHETNSFWGAGPWLALDLSWKTSVAGLAVFGRIDGALQFGHITQSASEDLVGSAGTGPGVFGAKYGWEVTVLSLAEEVGVSYTVPGWNHSRFLIGWHYETYFQLGRLNPTGAPGPPPNSRGQLDDQGLFLRAEFNF